MPPKSPAQVLLEKADKKANQSPGWFSSNSTRLEEAGDLYQQAANAFKLEKLFKEAGDAFAREAECREQCKEVNEAANAWWNAAKAYKRGYPELAIQALSQTIVQLTKSGRFRQAADREKEIGQIHLQENGDLDRACESFERAAEWYAQEDATAIANACFKDAADLHAERDRFDRAITLYEQVADHALTSTLTKFSVREYWLRAGLCALSMDLVKARRNIDGYAKKDNTFTATREYKFLLALLDAVQSNDLEGFTNIVVEYDSMTKLDNWKTHILLKIKRTIQEEPTLT